MAVWLAFNVCFSYRLIQVYIPNYNKPNPAAITKPGVNGDVNGAGRACESCYAAGSTQWYEKRRVIVMGFVVVGRGVKVDAFES